MSHLLTSLALSAAALGAGEPSAQSNQGIAPSGQYSSNAPAGLSPAAAGKIMPSAIAPGKFAPASQGPAAGGKILPAAQGPGAGGQSPYGPAAAGKILPAAQGPAAVGKSPFGAPAKALPSGQGGVYATPQSSGKTGLLHGLFHSN